MEGIIVEIADHPRTAQKIKVEVKGFSLDWDTEQIQVRTECRYYENVAGAYGPLIEEPTRIVFTRPLVADTKKDQFVDARTGEEIRRRNRDIQVQIGEEPIPVEEQEEGGPTTRPVYETQNEEYWVLESNEATEVPLEYVQRMFLFFEFLVRNVPMVVAQLLTNYVLAEVGRGTYYQVGR